MSVVAVAFASSKLVFRSCIIVSFVIIGVSYTCSESFRMHLFSVFPTYRNLVFSVQEAFLFFFCSRANRSSLSSRIYVIHFVFGECFLVECKYSF